MEVVSGPGTPYSWFTGKTRTSQVYRFESLTSVTSHES